MNNILIFELNWLGDILFSVPLLRAIKENYPNSRLTCAVVPRYAGLLKGISYVDEVIELSDRRGLFTFFEKISFVKKIRSKNFDTCFILKPSFTRTQMAVAASIGKIIGFNGKNARLTIGADLPAGSLHRIDQLLLLAKPACLTVNDTSYEYRLAPEDMKRAEDLLERSGEKGKKIIAVNPGGNWEAKRWPKERFIELVKAILSEFRETEIMITGAKKDMHLACEIKDACGSSRVFSVAGMTDLALLAALFKKSVAVVSADSGPMHLADAVGAKVVAIFGPTSPEVTGPRGKGKAVVIRSRIDCVTPCYLSKCDRAFECMSSVSVQEVLHALKEL